MPEVRRPVAKPPEMSSSPVRRVAGDLAVEWRGRGRYPPGPAATQSPAR